MKKAIVLFFTTFFILTTQQPAWAEETTRYFAFGESGGTAIGNGLLTPGERYSFPLMVYEKDTARQMTADDLKAYIVRLELPKGKQTLTEARIATRGGLVFFDIGVVGGWPAVQTELGFHLNLLDRSTGKVLYTIEEAFTTGYGIAHNETLLGLEAGEYIEVLPTAPIFTEGQFERLERLNDYQKLTFRGDGWKYTVNATGMPNTNLLYHTKPVEDLITLFPNYDFKVLSFPAGPQFGASGTLTVDVTDIEQDFAGKFYIYRYYKGVMTQLPYSYDTIMGTVTLETDWLGRFVFCDHPIPDGYKVF